MIIRIKRGTFGYFDGRKIVPKTKESGPFECDDRLAERLVSQGVAEYADGSADDRDGDLESLKKAQLVEIAEGLGIETAGKTKAELIGEIEDAGEHDAAQSDDAPVIEAAEVE